MVKLSKLENLKKITIKMISEKGYKGTSLRKLAKEAGVTNPFIYVHYKSKEDFVLSLFKEITAKVLQRFENEIKNINSVEDKIKNIVFDFLNFHNEKSYEVLFIQYCMKEFKTKIFKMKIRLLPDVLKEIIKLGQKQKKFIKEDASLLSFIVLGVLLSQVMLKNTGFIKNIKKEAELINKLIIKMLKK